MNRSVIFFLSAMIFLLLSCSESKETRLQRFLAQGNEMAELRHDEEAIKFYEGALALDSCFADAWNNMGTLYYNKKDYSEAIANYSRAIDCKPGYTAAHLNRANAYYETNEVFAALKDLAQVEKKNNDTLPLHFMRGLVYTKMKKYEEAKIAFVKALKISPQNVELKVNMGSVYYFDRAYDSARLWLKDVVATEKLPNAFNTLALVEVETGNYDQAVSLINRALELKKNDPYFLNNRGYIFLIMGQDEKAIADIDQSIGNDPYNAWAYRNKGIYMIKKSQYDDAIRLLSHAEKLDNSILNIYYYLGEAYWLKKDQAKACEFYKKSEELKDSLVKDPSKKCK